MACFRRSEHKTPIIKIQEIGMGGSLAGPQGGSLAGKMRRSGSESLGLLLAGSLGEWQNGPK